jgi:hypothetical protein
MTPDFRKQAHMLVSMFAMNGLIQAGMRLDEVPDAAHKIADQLMEKYEDAGIVALKPKRTKK